MHKDTGPTTISIDTGGTFTDGYFTRAGAAVAAKVFTTPHDVTVGMFECVEAGADALGMPVEQLVAQTDTFRFSSTIVTNAILERRGGVVGLITSPGNALVGEQLGDKGFLRPDLVAELGDPFDRAATERVVETLLDRGAQVLAVSLDESWRDPNGERAVRKTVRSLYPAHYMGAVRVFFASDVSALPGIAARTNTVVLNATVHELLTRTIYGAEDRVRDAGMRSPLLLVQSHGGVARASKTLAIQTYNSGPVAGALGALALLGDERETTGVAMDVGGTSTDIAVVDPAHLAQVWSTQLHGVDLHLPSIPVESSAIGGGTIAWIDRDQLVVGPRSAGSHPGPACFNRGGTQATVTDANLVLGFLDADTFHGGRFALRSDLAEGALRALGDRLGADTVVTARWVRARADALMADRIAETLARAGKRAQDATLVAYGGGGGLHAAAVAGRLGCRRVIVPWSAAVFSAVGVSSMDIQHLYGALLPPGVDTDELAAAARRDMLAEGRDWDDVMVETDVTEVPDGASGSGTVPLTVFRATAAVPAQGGDLMAGAERRETRTDPVDWGAGPEETMRITVSGPPPADLVVVGPSVLVTSETTVAVPRGWTARLDGSSLVLEKTK